MKGFSIFLILVVIIVIGFFVLRKPADAPIVTDTNGTGDEVPNAPNNINEDFDGTKQIDANKSTATWTGSKKLIVDYYDYGTVDVKSGNAVFANGILTGGEVVFDMASINATSTGKNADEDKLTGHLKSDAFFDVAKYPEAKFVITSAAREGGNTYLLSGDLTIKGKTAPVSFPADVIVANGTASIAGTATIDRTIYDVRFGSDKFFQDLGDNVINDEFILEFKAVTK